MKWFNFKRKSDEIHRKQLRSVRNRRYYERHRTDLLEKRKKRYRDAGK